MKCPNCNNEINPDSRFCKYCGARIERKQNDVVYYLVLDGKQAGPFNMDQLMELVSRKIMTKGTYVWREGMENWAFADTMSELKSLFVVEKRHAFESPVHDAPRHKERPVSDGRQRIQRVMNEQQCELEREKEMDRVMQDMQMHMIYDDNLEELCREVKGSDYIETLHLGRSWVLPGLVQMGFKNGSFSKPLYYGNLAKFDYNRIWRILLRNLRALSLMGNKSSATYRMRVGWWNRDVAVSLAMYDMRIFCKYISRLPKLDNCSGGDYVKTYAGMYFCDEPKGAKWRGSTNTINRLLEQRKNAISNILGSTSDRDLYNAVQEYYDIAKVNNAYARDSWNDELKLPKEYVNAFAGDGACSAMMTMLKYLKLTPADTTRDKCIVSIAKKVMDTGFNGDTMIDYCIEKFFDSGVFNLRNYRGY